MNTFNSYGPHDNAPPLLAGGIYKFYPYFKDEESGTQRTGQKPEFSTTNTRIKKTLESPGTESGLYLGRALKSSCCRWKCAPSMKGDVLTSGPVSALRDKTLEGDQIQMMSLGWVLIPWLLQVLFCFLKKDREGSEMAHWVNSLTSKNSTLHLVPRRRRKSTFASCLTLLL